MSENTMVDSMGNVVPVRYVSKYDRLRDKNARRVLARFQKTRAALEKLMGECLDDVLEIQVERLRETGTEVAEKGNFTCMSFDGLVEISIEQNYTIRLDDRVQQAQKMMLDYARGLVKGVEKDGAEALLLIIEEAFRAGSSGNLSVARVLSLVRKEVKSAAWQEAKKLLMDAMTTTKGRAYLRVRTRASAQHNWESIRLDIADCWPRLSSAAPEAGE